MLYDKGREMKSIKKTKPKTIKKVLKVLQSSKHPFTVSQISYASLTVNQSGLNEYSIISVLKILIKKHLVKRVVGTRLVRYQYIGSDKE